MAEELEERKKKIFDVFKKKKTYLIYLALIIIIWFSTRIRVKNLKYLVDSTTGQYIPVELDSFVILRYAQDILENGKMMVLDALRNYPIGFDPQREFSFISYFIVYLYKIIHVFVPSVTLEYIDAIYPPVTFAISLVFFFLVVKKLLDYRIALVATALLSVVPTYLYRTIAGFSDKEALAMMLMFIALYFYVSAWQSKKIGKVVILGVISGIVTGAMGLAWGGVGYVFLIISLFSLIELFLGKFRKIDFYVFTSWLLSLLFVLLAFSYGRFTLSNLAVSFTTGIAFMTFLVALVDFLVFKLNLFKIKQKIEAKMPLGVASTIIAVILTAIGSSIFFGIMFIPNKIKEVVSGLIYPLTNRWALTVAESHQPYVIDWFSQLGNWYAWLML
ncbi:glycosyltransferase family 39 protein, partial [Candidatus Woesearchaeota archaeon]|nr:glycosyltransferase family 39 protein [Candidatus Woesearchaeota archaeon]